MSETLGEKLRQAREARGLSISDIAEQTRISALYLSCIENDDYRTLPGGIFNKGFVKSFAKTVGVDEQEALQDYARLLVAQGTQINEEPKKTYRSEVLTDESNSVLNAPTIIGAIIILALMTGGILFLLNYLQKNSSQTVANTNAATNANTNVNAVSAVNANSNTSVSTSNAPSMSDLKVEIKALKSPLSVTATVDGKQTSSLATPDKSLLLEPKQTLRIKYAKAQSNNVEMTINNKTITLPPVSANSGRNVIEFEITGEKLAAIWSSGQIAADAAPPATR